MDRQALLDALNPDQREVADCTTNCLAVAAPGSGKTKTLATKAALLLHAGSTVTAVTFTRDAALELRERILLQAGHEYLPRLLVGTYHSVDLLMAFPSRAKSEMGRDILSKSKSKLNKPWRIVNEGLRRSAVDRAILESGLMELDLQSGTSLIEAVKSGNKVPTDQEREAVEIYTKVLARHNSIDFQDILLLTNQGMKSGDITPLQTDHLLLDEFQDSDQPQLDWAIHHGKCGAIATAVGDDDQSIYAFRRALGYGGMQTFAQTLSAQTVVLGLNYRSHSEILAPSSRLIEANLERMPKALVAFKGMGGTVAWEYFPDRQTEAVAIVNVLEKRWLEGCPESSAILSRTNRRLDEVEALLVQRAIPYVRTGGSDSIFDSQPAMAFLCALKALVSPDKRSTDALLGWYGLAEGDLSLLHSAYPKGVLAPLSERLNLAKKVPDLSVPAKETVNRLSRRFAEWRTFLETGGLRFVVEQLRDDLAIGAKEKRDVKALSVIAEIVVPSYKEGRQPRDVPLAQRLKELEALKRSDGKSEGTEEEDARENKPMVPPVILTTAHASKGLEYDWVWILGAEMGTFPDETSAVQEERRLFYVAMTRARKTLRMSGAGAGGVSQFILESGSPRAPAGTY